MSESPPCKIDAFGPLPVRRPSSVTEVGELVAEAATDEQAIYAVGGGTQLDFGLPPVRPGLGIDMRALDRIIDYPARDMTVTVEAGITMARLQELLATENQRLPIDVPRAREATLGGTLAANVSGPRRYGFGTLRDYMIGISVVNDEGHETKAGGRVVKNVAGYDLCKLHIGALGTLGIISQVTLKLRPLPEERAIVIVPCDSGSLTATFDLLHHSRARPVCLDVLNHVAVAHSAQSPAVDLPASGWIVVIGLEDNRSAVTWQVQQLIHELIPSHPNGLEARVGVATDAIWETLVEGPSRQGDVLTVKANVLPSVAGEFCERATQLVGDPAVHAHAGNGIVNVHFDAGISLEQARDVLRRMLEWSGRDGNVIVRRCPSAWKTALSIWGKPPPGEWLMRKVKAALDPRGLFNPGRFVGGI